jgi:predicted CopG family antitoxin
MNKQYRPRISKDNYEEVMEMASIGDSFDVALRRYRKRAHGLGICRRNSQLKSNDISTLMSKNKELQRDNVSLEKQVGMANSHSATASRLLANREKSCRIALRKAIALRSECQKLRVVIVFLIAALLFVASLLIA